MGVGATWTFLTGACTGVMSLLTMGMALMFGLPLVLGGIAVWLAGSLLRRDPADHKTRSTARLFVIISTIASAVGIGVIVWDLRQIPDAYGLTQLFGCFDAAGLLGALTCLVVSVHVWRKCLHHG